MKEQGSLDGVVLSWSGVAEEEENWVVWLPSVLGGSEPSSYEQWQEVGCFEFFLPSVGTDLLEEELEVVQPAVWSKPNRHEKCTAVWHWSSWLHYSNTSKAASVPVFFREIKAWSLVIKTMISYEYRDKYKCLLGWFCFDVQILSMVFFLFLWRPLDIYFLVNIPLDPQSAWHSCQSVSSWLTCLDPGEIRQHRWYMLMNS